jgi:hypothetical protein
MYATEGLHYTIREGFSRSGLQIIGGRARLPLSHAHNIEVPNDERGDFPYKILEIHHSMYCLYFYVIGDSVYIEISL